MYFRKKVDTVNFILALLVMFIHSYNIEQYLDIEGLEKTWAFQIEFFLSHALGDMAVPCFFMISAYLFFRKYKWNKIIEKYKTRVKSVLIPYLCWNFLYYVAFLVLVSIPFFKYFMDTQQVIFTIKELFLAIYIHKYNGVYWFMQQLIFFILISPLLLLLLRRKVGILFLVFIFVIGNLGVKLSLFLWDIRLDMLAYWVLGGYLAFNYAALFENKRNKRNSAVWLLIFSILLGTRYWLNNLILPPGRSILGGVLMLNVLSFWHALDLFNLEQWRLHWWMRITFFIYSMHPLLVDAIKKAMAKLLPHTSRLALCNYFLAVGISLIIVIVIAKIMICFTPQIWRVLNGGRQQNIKNGINEEKMDSV